MRVKTNFLKLVVILMGLFILTLCIFWVPPIAVYFAQILELPFLKYIIFLFFYSTAIPYFFALYQTLMLLGNIDRQMAFSKLSIDSLMYIKYCAIIIFSLYAVGLPLLFIMAQADDAPGLVLIGLVIALVSTIIAIFSAILQKLLTSAMEVMSKNDLTV